MSSLYIVAIKDTLHVNLLPLYEQLNCVFFHVVHLVIPCCFDLTDSIEMVYTSTTLIQCKREFTYAN